MDRSCGVLLHPTSLPSDHGIGDFGPGAQSFVAWLAAAGVEWWQVLPLNAPGPGDSPYSAISTFAGNTLLISPERLADDGLLTPEELERDRPVFDAARVDFGAVTSWKEHLLGLAFERFEHSARAELAAAQERFVAEQADWLEDFALFVTLKAENGGTSWLDWPEELRLRDISALAQAGPRLDRPRRRIRFEQFVFDRQWRALRDHAAQNGVRLFGDLPIFVAMDSAEVWSRPELFELSEDGAPTVVAGVPPDYFSATGQLWGNPLYAWEEHAATGYRWWIDRLRRALDQVDVVRLDHFRGFAAHWEVPAGDADAIRGRWRPGPGEDLFEAVRAELGALPLVAEDLGDITPDVIELRRRLELPGMAILQFGFSPDPRSSFIPYNHERDQVVYTGTHDNNTSAGWYADEAAEGERDLLRRYVGSDGSDVHWDLVRLALASVADLAVIPMQDLLGLGSEARMNRPSTALGNWDWRLEEADLSAAVQQRLANLVDTYGRRPLSARGRDGAPDDHG